jgi:putative membrane protein
MVKRFIDNSHTRKQLSSDELQAIKKELIQTYIHWIAAFRYQMRANKP